MRLVARLMTALLVATLILPALAVGPAFAAVADHLSVTVSPGSGVAGDSFDVAVDALDGTNAVDTGYVGTVHFTSTDTNGPTSLPPDYTFLAGDNGTKTFNAGATLTTSGPQTITATDLGDGSINGTSNSITIAPGSSDAIVLTGSVLSLTSGAGRTFTATLLDQYGNVTTNDSSTVVTFSQTAGAGSVSGEGTDTATAGIAAKTLTGVLAGSVSITATSASTSDSNIRTFTVAPGAASQIALSGAVTGLASGTGRVFTATLKDDAGNVATGDSTTSVLFSKTSGSGTVTGTALIPRAPASHSGRSPASMPERCTSRPRPVPSRTATSWIFRSSQARSTASSSALRARRSEPARTRLSRSKASTPRATRSVM